VCANLTTYILNPPSAVKIGRTPTLIDLDVSQNLLSVPGTVAASTITLDNISPATQASSTNIAPNTSSLVLWHGSTDIKSNADLYKAQVEKLGAAIDLRLNQKNKDVVASSAGDQSNGNANTSTNTNQMDGKAAGIIVNTSGWIEDKGYQILLHTIQALRINVILVLKSEKLYSMLQSHFKKVKESMNNGDVVVGGGVANVAVTVVPKVIKLRESGGLCSRNVDFRSITRRDCIKRYFYGESIISKRTKPEEPAQIVSQYSPSLVELPFSDLTLFRLSGVSLSASMLPVSAKQATDAVQLTPVNIEPTLTKAVLAVCHPTAVNSYMSSGDAKDLYLSGISGFVVVDKIDLETEMLSLLSPCAGELPSKTLLVGDVAWLE
jgi:polyribonucleotide 5'-hydroxyl-kinase